MEVYRHRLSGVILYTVSTVRKYDTKDLPSTDLAGDKSENGYVKKNGLNKRQFESGSIQLN